jgi:hypothetical protein
MILPMAKNSSYEDGFEKKCAPNFASSGPLSSRAEWKSKSERGGNGLPECVPPPSHPSLPAD